MVISTAESQLNLGTGTAPSSSTQEGKVARAGDGRRDTGPLQCGQGRVRGLARVQPSAVRNLNLLVTVLVPERTVTFFSNEI